MNFGRAGACAMTTCGAIYSKLPHYKAALSSHPHIVIIEFGTNDVLNSKYNEKLFIKDYIDIINAFKALSSRPSIYINTPNPYYCDPKEDSVLFEKANTYLPSMIRKIRDITGVTLIDLFPLLGGYNLLYKDGMNEDQVHPNDLGYTSIAHEVAFQIAEHENFTLIHHHKYKVDHNR